jgi:hypothetical protein
VSSTTQSRGPQKSATIHDVARAARVSTATVSRALSNPDLLSDRTRAAVMDAIRTTGYRVNQAARNLRMQRAGAVLILVPTSASRSIPASWPASPTGSPTATMPFSSPIPRAARSARGSFWSISSTGGSTG